MKFQVAVHVRAGHPAIKLIIFDMRKFLLVNPPIYDFAAHDFWLKPYGLLRVASLIKSAGGEVIFFDFMDRNHPDVPKTRTDRYGRGKFFHVEVPKPPVLDFVPRKFKRYGVPEEHFVRFLKETGDIYAVLIATGMTYWYLGVLEVAETVRKIHPESKIVLGGIYTSIMPEHAKETIEPDFIDNRNPLALLDYLELPAENLTPDFSPDWSLYPKLDYGVIKLTDGCPFRCTYCAVWKLAPRFRVRDIELVMSELDHFARRGIKDIVFYDDALLVRADRGLLPFLERIPPGRFRFHTPNALHARFITSEVARKMKTAGFETIYIGYETTDPVRQEMTGGKVTAEAFLNAVENLLSAGFSREQITVYLLMGLPGQPPEEVEAGIREVAKLGLKVMLSEYSPIPGTPDGEKARRIIDISEPLLQNNIVFPIAYYGIETVRRLKALKQLANAGKLSQQ